MLICNLSNSSIVGWELHVETWEAQECAVMHKPTTALESIESVEVAPFRDRAVWVNLWDKVRFDKLRQGILSYHTSS